MNVAEFWKMNSTAVIMIPCLSAGSTYAPRSNFVVCVAVVELIVIGSVMKNGPVFARAMVRAGIYRFMMVGFRFPVKYSRPGTLQISIKRKLAASLLLKLKVNEPHETRKS